MAETELSIVLKLIDNATSGIKESISKTTKQFNNLSDESVKLGREINSVGRELTRIGATMTFVGGAIQAFFIKALIDTSKNSLAVNQALQVLSSEFDHLQRTIGEAVLPVLNQITIYFDNFNKTLDSISRPLRDNIFQFIFLSSIFLSLAGIISIVTGKLFEMAGNILKLAGGLLSLNPYILATVAALTTIIFLMFKFSDTTKQVLNALQSLFLSLEQGFLSIKAGLENFVASGLEALSSLYDKLSGLPGPLKEFYQQAAISSLQAANNFRSLANDDLVNAKIAALELKDIMMNQNGSWAEGFQAMKDKAMQVIEAIKNIGNVSQRTAIVAQISFKEMINGAQTALSALSSALSGAAQANKQFARAAQAIAIALAIVNTAQGVTKALAEFKWPLSLVVGGIIAAAGAIQIATIASQKFHSGGLISGGLASDERPIIAQTGEGILSRKGMSALGGEGNLNRLNQGQGVSGGQNINVSINYPNFRSREDINELVDQIGFELQKQLRYAS